MIVWLQSVDIILCSTRSGNTYPTRLANGIRASGTLLVGTHLPCFPLPAAWWVTIINSSFTYWHLCPSAACRLCQGAQLPPYLSLYQYSLAIILHVSSIKLRLSMYSRRAHLTYTWGTQLDSHRRQKTHDRVQFGVQLSSSVRADKSPAKNQGKYNLL